MRTAKNRSLGLLLCLAALTPISGQAFPVTVQFAGSLTAASDPGVVGQQFSVSVSLDTDAALLGIDSGGSFDPGLRYRYDPFGMSMIVSLPGLADISIMPDPAFFFNLIYVRDNSGDANAVPDGPPAVTDGISLSVQDASWRSDVIIRGAILDMFDGGDISGLFDPRLLDQGVTGFQMFSFDGSEFYGNIDSFAVIPLPAAVWLFGSALLGLAGVSRRLQR